MGTPKWVEWLNHRRLFEPISDMTAAEKENLNFQNLEWPRWPRCYTSSFIPLNMLPFVPAN